MARERYAVQLSAEEHERFTQLVPNGRSSARIVGRARIVLKIDEH